MAKRMSWVLIWSYTAWYAASVAGWYLGSELALTVSPAAGVLAGLVAARRTPTRQPAT